MLSAESRGQIRVDGRVSTSGNARPADIVLSELQADRSGTGGFHNAGHHRAQTGHEVIREERDRAQSYLDIADVILLALDLDGRITLINRKGCATLGREESELLGRDWIETCLPPRTHRDLKAFFRTLLDGELSSLENPVLTSSGEERMIGW